jgi:hypothetical protein
MLMPASEYELEDEYEGEWEGELEGESEWEWENEDEWEFEGELNPIRRVYPDALMEMEHLGHAAAEAETEAEAEAFIGALIPMAARLLPRVAPAIMRAAPRLIRGATRIARTLRRRPATRQLVRTIPTIVRRTAATLARQTAQGRPVTPQVAAQTLARQATRVLRSPQQRARALQRSCALDGRYHRAAATPAAGRVVSTHRPVGARRPACPACGRCVR